MKKLTVIALTAAMCISAFQVSAKEDLITAVGTSDADSAVEAVAVDASVMTLGDENKLTKCVIKCSARSGPGGNPGCNAEICVGGTNSDVCVRAEAGGGPDTICKALKDKKYTNLELCAGEGGRNTGKFGCDKDGKSTRKPGAGEEKK